MVVDVAAWEFVKVAASIFSAEALAISAEILARSRAPEQVDMAQVVLDLDFGDIVEDFLMIKVFLEHVGAMRRDLNAKLSNYSATIASSFQSNQRTLHATEETAISEHIVIVQLRQI